MRAIGAVVVLAALAAGARADDRGFTWGGFAGPGYDSRSGYRTGFDLELGQRIDHIEWAVAPRVMVIGHTAVFETMALFRVFVAPSSYVEAAAGIAFLPGNSGGDFVHLPDLQPCLSVGVGQNLVRSQHWLLDVRAMYTVDFGFTVDNEKSTIQGVLVGPALRFY